VQPTNLLEDRVALPRLPASSIVEEMEADT
jgi:hypothetical protein